MSFIKAVLSSKGQITVPKAIREILHVENGDSLVFYIEDNEVISTQKVVNNQAFETIVLIDDELIDICLEKLYEAYEKSNADFVYSDALEIIDNMPIYYGEYFSYGQGYYRDEEINGINIENIAITCRNINIKSIRGIHALPNHVRSWKRTFYHEIGGHNIELSVLDDMDLLIRTFLQGKIAKVDKVLYIQHQGMSQENGRGKTATGARVKEIQRLNSLLKWKYEQAIHNRILELGFDDPIWDDNLKESNLDMDLNTEQIIPMDILIIK